MSAKPNISILQKNKQQAFLKIYFHHLLLTINKAWKILSIINEDEPIKSPLNERARETVISQQHNGKRETIYLFEIKLKPPTSCRGYNP